MSSKPASSVKKESTVSVQQEEPHKTRLGRPPLYQTVDKDEFLDQRMKDFCALTEEEKDKLTCDEVFCMYLRSVCKVVNESYYKQA